MSCATPIPPPAVDRGREAIDDLWFLTARIRLVMLSMSLERAARAFIADVRR